MDVERGQKRERSKYGVPTIGGEWTLQRRGEQRDINC